MVGNDLGPLVPLAGLGGDVRRVRAGPEEDVVVCVQGEKMVHVYNTNTNSLQHTWYANTGTIVHDVATADNKSDVVILVNKKEIVLADRDKNKMEDCERVRLEDDATEIVTVGGTNYIVFSNGAVEDLKFLTQRAEAGQRPPGVLEEGETLLESEVRWEASGQMLVSHLVTRDQALASLTGRLVLDITSGAHTVEEVTRRNVASDIRQLKCFILDKRFNVIMVNSGDTLQVFTTAKNCVEDLANVPAGSKHLAITDIGEDQIGVMGTLTEGGYLHTFSRAFNCVIASCNMKTTGHRGRGLYYIQDKLLITVTNRVISTSLTDHSLHTLLGRMSTSSQQITASLSDEVLDMPDMPEHIIVDCLLLLLDSDKGQDSRLAVFRKLVRRDISDSVMNQQIKEKINMEQAIKILELLELLLQQNDCETEERALEWINMIVTCHYLQIVLCSEERLDSVRTDLRDTVNRIKARLKVLSECRATLHNLLNTKAPPVQISNQIYSIEILQI